jgi:hypothetical protein
MTLTLTQDKTLQMANWLEITNTFINLNTMQRVGDLSRAQQQAANQMLALELRKQQDNTLLSQLVDVLVKVRQFLQDKQYFDALLCSGVGVLAFKQVYPQIVDADTKLKASDIQVRLLETMRSTISDDSIRSSLQTLLAQYLSTLKGRVQQSLAQLEDGGHRLFWLNPAEDWEIDIGEEFTPIQDLINPSNKVVIFRKGNLYKVVDVNTSGTNGFYLINDLGQKWYLFFGKNGGADLFAFFDPPLPSSEVEIAGWELCERLFSDEFLVENLKSVRSDMLNIYVQAWEQAQVLRPQLVESVSQYKQLRQNIVNRSLQTLQIQSVSKPSESNIGVVIGLIVFISFFIIPLLIGHC